MARLQWNIWLLVLLIALPVTASEPASEPREAVFAGGCFWCMESPFDALDGVISTTSGYIGGDLANPTYEQVAAGETGHAEAVRVTYDPERINYEALLDVYWRNIDPLDPDGQFCDRGSQYRSAIFPRNPRQRELARESRQTLEASGRFEQPVVTTIESAATFYPAEDYHQDYYRQHPWRYTLYRKACGRDHRLQELWGN